MIRSFPVSGVFWFTGMSGAGKSTIAHEVFRRLHDDGAKVLILDGDAVRSTYHRHLGFTAADIREHLRLVAERCVEAMADHDVVLVPVISPLADARAAARRRIGANFRLVYVRASIATLEERDPKGLYARARRGEMTDLIGYSPGAVPFEEPADADLVLDTDAATEENEIAALTAFVRKAIAAG